MSRNFWRTAGRILLFASSPAISVAGPFVAGDCNRDGSVVLHELVLGVNVALDLRSIEECDALDGNGDGAATVDELLAAVFASFGDVSPTPTPSITSTPTATPTATLISTATLAPTSTLTPTSSPTPSRTPAVVRLAGVCTRGLGRCASGTTMRVMLCPSPEGRPCASEDAATIAETTTGADGSYEITLDGKDVAGRALLIEADVAPQATWHMMTFGALLGGGGGSGVGGTLAVDIGPDTEAAFRLLSESGIESFPPDHAESIFDTVIGETAGLPATLENLGIENPVEVATAYTGQAEANVAVRQLLGMPTDTFLSVEFASQDGCVETGQIDRIDQDGFEPFLLVFTDSKEGRLDDVPLEQVDEYFVIGQRRNDGSFRLLARSTGYDRTVTGLFRGDLLISAFNGTGTLNLEIQLHVKRTDVGAAPTPSLNGDGCVDQGPERTCAKCTIPLQLQ